MRFLICLHTLWRSVHHKVSIIFRKVTYKKKKLVARVYLSIKIHLQECSKIIIFTTNYETHND